MNKQTVVEVARLVVARRKKGQGVVLVRVRDEDRLTKFQAGTVWRNGRAVGYCTRFIRQVHECALGLAPYEWAYRAADARQLESNLERAGLRIDKPEPGDVVCLNDDSSGRYGHVAILVDKGLLAENTSSGRRGNPREPGTKLTPFGARLKKRVTGYYATMPASKEELRTVLMIEHGTGKVLDSFELVPGGNHIEDQGKVYVKR